MNLDRKMTFALSVCALLALSLPSVLFALYNALMQQQRADQVMSLVKQLSEIKQPSSTLDLSTTVSAAVKISHTASESIPLGTTFLVCLTVLHFLLLAVFCFFVWSRIEKMECTASAIATQKEKSSEAGKEAEKEAGKEAEKRSGENSAR